MTAVSLFNTLAFVLVCAGIVIGVVSYCGTPAREPSRSRRMDRTASITCALGAASALVSLTIAGAR